MVNCYFLFHHKYIAPFVLWHSIYPNINYANCCCCCCWGRNGHRNGNKPCSSRLMKMLSENNRPNNRKYQELLGIVQNWQEFIKLWTTLCKLLALLNLAGGLSPVSLYCHCSSNISLRVGGSTRYVKLDNLCELFPNHFWHIDYEMNRWLANI